MFGSAGVGKTTFAKEICKKWNGKKYVFDLRETKYMTVVYLNIMGKLDLNIQDVRLGMGTVVGRIHDLKLGRFCFFLTMSSSSLKERVRSLKTQFVHFLGELSKVEGKSGSFNILLSYLLTPFQHKKESL